MYRSCMIAVVAAAFSACVSSANAKNTDKPEVETNSIGMKLVHIPAGEFEMGGHEPAERLVKDFPGYGKPAEYFKDEYPRHKVRITRPFLMGQCEVTVGQFKKFADDTHYKTEPETDGKGGWGYDARLGQCDGRRPEFNWRNVGFPQTDEHPVIDVTWNDANALCKWLSAREGKKYRLPTEAEWEYACRAGTGSRYAYGDAPASLDKAANVMDGAGRESFPAVQNLNAYDKLRFTAPVGTRQPNRWGLHDIHGNVWEWCSDWYGEDYYGKSPLDDPTGPATGKVRMRRGGAWNTFPLWSRASFRNWNSPQTRCVNVGFRVVREEGEKK